MPDPTPLAAKSLLAVPSWDSTPARPSRYAVYATRWDDPHIVEEIATARDLEFTMPLMQHGEATFSATVEPGLSVWRPALSPIISGVIIAKDDVPVWSGWVTGEEQQGPRTFQFHCVEWGAFFARCPAVGASGGTAPKWTGVNDHQIFTELVRNAQQIAGQDVGVEIDLTSRGAASSDLTINAWDHAMTEPTFVALGNAEGGPEWYFTGGGTLQEPRRILMLEDRLGKTEPEHVLEYVEDTAEYVRPAAPPTPTLLGNLFPGQQPQARVGRTGGNIIAAPMRSVDGTQFASAVTAVGAGEEKDQITADAESNLLALGFPRQTDVTTYSEVTRPATLQKHADADLAASSGLLTVWQVSTYASEPDVFSVGRGDTVRCEFDTDVYGGDRPTVFESRVLSITVKVPDQGDAEATWTLAEVVTA